MPIVRAYLFARKEDNKVGEYIEAPFEEWAETLTAAHRVTEDKNGDALVFGHFLTDDFVPVTYPKYGATGEVISEDVPTDTAGKPFVRRCSVNLTHVSAAVLDFDGEVPIEQIIATLEGFTYVAYTSHSHGRPLTADDREKGKTSTDRLRVILPFTAPCPKDEWSARKHHLADMFPGCDRGGSDLSRVFYTPACPAERQHLAMSWSAEGAAFDWSILPPKPKAILYIEQSTPTAPKPLVKGGYGKVDYDTFDAEQFFRDQGLYLRSKGFGKAEVKCPNYQAHSAAAIGGTVLYTHLNGGGPTWHMHCSHNSCAQGAFNVREHFKNQLGKGWMKPYCLREPEVTLATIKAKAESRKTT